VDITFRLELLGDPAGQIDLRRLYAFSRRFRAAALRSAQAALSVPAYRRTLGDEPAPEYRLSGLSEGSTVLRVSTADERPISSQAVTRHIEAIEAFSRTGEWPPHMYAGERQAWAEVYRSLFRRDRGAAAVVQVNGGGGLRVDAALTEQLAKAQLAPDYQEVELVGTLHLIEVEVNPEFRIRTETIDLTFPLTDDVQARVDELRWRRVLARALWEVGSQHARLTAPLEATDQPAGLIAGRHLELPAWVSAATARIDSLTHLADGWDGPGTKRLSKTVIERGREFVRRIFESFSESVSPQAPPRFGPNSDGGLEFEWQIGDRFLNGEILSGGYDLYAAEGDEDLFEGPVSQEELFGWIRWLLTGERPPGTGP
jgi:hypothetical protein